MVIWRLYLTFTVLLIAQVLLNGTDFLPKLTSSDDLERVAQDLQNVCVSTDTEPWRHMVCFSKVVMYVHYDIVTKRADRVLDWGVFVAEESQPDRHIYRTP
ncbi:hypothetical protein EON64_05975, partial [archaeon]